MNPTFVAPPHQKFACQSCASRCCTMPWKVLITQQEKERFEAQEWIRERMGKAQASFKKVNEKMYALPLVERTQDRRLVCLFLDDDGLCSQYKHHGFDFWSRTCKTFPFEFIELEDGLIRTSLSHHCPSIRDNYGEPLEPQLEKYYEVSGGIPKKLAEKMILGPGTILNQTQWIPIVHWWEQQIHEEESLAQALLNCFLLTLRLANSLLSKKQVTDERMEREIQKAARHIKTAPPLPSYQPEHVTFFSRLLVAISLARLTHPIRLFQEKKFSPRNMILTYRNTIRLLRMKGEIDLLQMPKPFDLAQVKHVSPVFENQALHQRAKAFYTEALARRNLFCQERSLHDILLDLGLSYAIMLHVTKFRATAYERASADLSDLGEGIAFAECFFLYHYSRQAKPLLLELLLAMLSTNEPSYRGILTVEG